MKSTRPPQTRLDIALERINGIVRRNSRWAGPVVKRISQAYKDKRELEKLARSLEEIETHRAKTPEDITSG